MRVKNGLFIKKKGVCENCAFPQKFHTRKLGEITVFYAVSVCKKGSSTWENFSKIRITGCLNKCLSLFHTEVVISKRSCNIKVCSTATDPGTVKPNIRPKSGEEQIFEREDFGFLGKILFMRTL